MYFSGRNGGEWGWLSEAGARGRGGEGEGGVCSTWNKGRNGRMAMQRSTWNNGSRRGGQVDEGDRWPSASIPWSLPAKRMEWDQLNCGPAADWIAAISESVVSGASQPPGRTRWAAAWMARCIWSTARSVTQSNCVVSVSARPEWISVERPRTRTASRRNAAFLP